MSVSANNMSAPQRVRRRLPAIPVVLAFGSGIVADSYLAASGWVWFVASATAFAIACLAWFSRKSKFSVVCLLVAVAGTGAVRHHEAWSVGEANDVGLFAREDALPARLIGRITQRPVLPIVNTAEFAQRRRAPERTTFTIQCLQLRDGLNWIDVSGSVRVDVTGAATELRIGDEVELIGRIARPEAPKNVGEFDFPAFMRRQGIRAVMRCRSPEAIVVRHRPEDLNAEVWRQLVVARNYCDTLLRDKLQPDTASVATALLLGSRTKMSQQQREAFVESGTMHVLAISGLNVAILAMFVGGVCRWLNLSRGISTASILMLVGGYTAITEAGPPVVRASLLVFVAALGWPWDRPARGANLLAVTGLGVLLWNPTDIFNAGAQLSFLAVAVILWHVGRSHVEPDASVDLDQQDAAKPQDLARELAAKLPMTWSRKLLLAGWSAVRETTLLSSFIWLFTAPITMDRFHLVSPVGVLVNIPLLPVAGVTLCLGYCTLLVGFVSDWMASQLAVVFEWSLRLMLFIVDVAAEFCCGHRYVPAPPKWYLAGAVVLLATLLWTRNQSFRSRVGWKAAWIWAVVGLLWPLVPREPLPLRCTMLSVGHGLAVLIETPSGRAILYDAGMIGDSRRTTEIVQQALWHRGHSRLDGIVLSHADTDHMNGVPGLLRTIPVGRLLVSPQFLDWQQPVVKEVLDTASHCRVPVNLVWQGDSLPLDDDVRCRVLHPHGQSRLSPDNANSIVLAIEYRGRRFLLTGDLEREGLQRLLKTLPLRTDVLLSPHHGSTAANTTDLARWAAPSWLVVSGDKRVNLKPLQERFGPATVVLNTATDGAISFEVNSCGELFCQTFRRSVIASE